MAQGYASRPCLASRVSSLASCVSSLASRPLSLALLLLVILAVLVYFYGTGTNPPGFFVDESSIAYNAHTISRHGTDEHGVSWPLFFRAFGEYKSPVYVYLLAAVYTLTGPSITAARALSALLGLSAALLLGLVAARSVAAHDEGADEKRDVAAGTSETGDGADDEREMRDVVDNKGATGNGADDGRERRDADGRACVVGLTVALSALLTPWLFEVGRLVFEVALMPLALALLMLALRSAYERGVWEWRDSINVALALALVTYTYSVGRLLAPLLALGLILFARRGRVRRVVLRTWLLYAATLAPLVLFFLRHPGALGERFAQVSFIRPEMTWAQIALTFLRNYALAFSPWNWLAAGDPEPRHHVAWLGSLLLGTVLAALVGLFIVLRRRRADVWWRFVLYGLVVAPLPGALTLDRFHTLRLIALPVFLLILAAHGLAWMLRPVGRARVRRALFVTLLLLTLVQGALFLLQFYEEAPRRWHSFDAFYPEVFDAATARSERPIYLIDNTGAPGYIHAYWYATLRGMDPARDFVRLPKDTRPPPGALVISTELPCADCELILQRAGFRVYVQRQR